MTTIPIAQTTRRRMMKFLVNNLLQTVCKKRVVLIHVLPEASRINSGRHTTPGSPENEAGMLFIPPWCSMTENAFNFRLQPAQSWRLHRRYGRICWPQSSELTSIKLLDVFITSGSLYNANEFWLYYALRKTRPVFERSQVLRTLFSEKDTLLPRSAIDKYSISHPDSFLQQIVNAGKVKESEAERGGQLRHKFSPGRRLGAEGRSLALRNILVLPGIPISPYSHTDTHSDPKYYGPSTFSSKATKFFPSFTFAHLPVLRKIMVKRSCCLSLLTHVSASQTHLGEGA